MSPRRYIAKKADTFCGVQLGWTSNLGAVPHSGSTLGFLQGSIVCVADPKTRRARLRIGTLKWAKTVARQAAGTVWQTFHRLDLNDAGDLHSQPAC